MRAVVYAIAGVLIILAVVRRVRRRREPSGTPRRVVVHRLASRFGLTGMVAGREIRERLRGRIFRVVTLVLLIVVAAAIVIPTIKSNSKSTTRVGYVGTLSPALRDEIVQTAKHVPVTIHLVQEPSLAAARDALRAGTIDLVIDGEQELLVNKPISATDSSAGARFVHTLATDLGVDKALQAAGLTAAQVAELGRARALPIGTLQPAPKQTVARSTSLIGVILVFIMLTQYLTWTLMGVMEEKASRVVEVLLATVRPVQLLGGKVLGIGVTAMLQAGLVVAFALILAKAVGSDLLTGTAPLVVVATLVWLVLGYAFYSWVYAAAGSMAERQDQVQSMALPLSIPIIFGYIVALTNAAGNPSVLVKVLAFLPPTAPFAMPTLVAAGATTLWLFLLSAAISVVATFGTARVAAAIYRRAVLRTGGRVHLRAMIAH
jgi:ABC-2 type transport system permease protein